MHDPLKTISPELRYVVTCVVRRLRLHIVCARDPVDRTLAKVFNFPYWIIERDREFLCRAQCLLRRIPGSLANLKLPADARERHLVVQRGLEMQMLASFGIEIAHRPKFQRKGWWEAVSDTFVGYGVGDFGPLDDPDSRNRLTIALGKVIREYERPADD